MTEKDLKKLIKLCKKEGVISLKTGDTELTFTHAAVEPKTKKTDPITKAFSEGIVNPNTGKPYTPEEILFYSTNDTTQMGDS